MADSQSSDFCERFGVLQARGYISWPPDDSRVGINVELLRALLDALVRLIPFHEQYYISRYPDVSEAIAQGLFKTAFEHYKAFGYYEDRLPCHMPVDERYYILHYPDVQVGIASGSVESAQAHFDTLGYKEGRLPFAGWSLLNADLVYPSET
jgi:hypothetical protein